MENELLKQIDIQIARVDSLKYSLERGYTENIREIKRIITDLQRQKQIVEANIDTMTRNIEKGYPLGDVA